MNVRSLIGVFTFLLLTSCLPEQSIEVSNPPPSDSPDSNDQPSVERAVFIELINQNTHGAMVRCRLNDVLEGSVGRVPVFIELNGVVLEHKEFTSVSATVPFARFPVNSPGDVVCVAELFNAEFDSEPLALTP